MRITYVRSQEPSFVHAMQDAPVEFKVRDAITRREPQRVL